MIGVLLVRRFRDNGQLVELSHLAEVAALSPKGWQVDFADGSGTGVVAWGKITLRDFSPGFHGPRSPREKSVRALLGGVCEVCG